MTDLDRLLQLRKMFDNGFIIRTEQGITDEYNEYNSLKSKIEQELRKAEKQGDWEVLLGTNQELEQQNKELRVQLHNSTQVLKDEIKQLKEKYKNTFATLLLQEQKLENIEALTEGKNRHIKLDNIKEILRGKEK